MHVSSQSPLITMRDLADLLGYAYSTVSRMRVAGELPIATGKRHRPRWCRDDVLRWIEAGMPSQADWTARKQQEKS